MRDGGDKEVQSFIGRMMTKGRGLVMAHGWNDWPQALTKLSYLVSSLVTSYQNVRGMLSEETFEEMDTIITNGSV